MALNRRQMLLASGAALLSPAALGRLSASEKAAPKKVLFFTKSQTFQHGPITRSKDAKLGLAERLLTEMGKEHDFEVVASKDGTLFDPDKIDQWDAFFFYTTGDLTKPSSHDPAPPMSEKGKQAFLDAIKKGKGFIGVHSATDTFHSKSDKELDPYIEMIGGEFIVHGSQQKVKLIVADPSFPHASAFGTPTYELKDEWYALKNQAEDMHVIIAHDTASFEDNKGGNSCYNRPNFPETWAKMYGLGRVFYTSMGHREEVWNDKSYQELLLGALSWVTGKVDADIKPNVKTVTPDYKTLKNV